NNDYTGLKRTQIYPTETNLQHTKADYELDASGNIKGNIEIFTQGTQYGDRIYLERTSSENLSKYYKRYFSNINNLKLLSTQFTHDSKQHSFMESISIEAEKYAIPSGGRIMFVVNSFNTFGNIPQRYRNRATPFEIQRGFKDIDEYTITIP